MKRYNRFLPVMIFSFIFFISCTSIKIDPNDPNAHLIQNVKMVYQGKMQCAAACLTMILSYYGLDVSMNNIDSEIRPGSGGVSCPKLVMYSSSLNFKTDWFITTDVKQIKDFISRDIPLIARVHCEPKLNICHYVVLVGYTDKGFIVNDPLKGRRFKNYQAFKKWHSCAYFGCGPYWTVAIYR